MSYFIITLILFCLVLLWFIIKEINKMKDRQKIFEKWLFDSLYSINSNVILPEQIAALDFKKAKIIAKNPMNEFTGLLDDRDID